MGSLKILAMATAGVAFITLDLGLKMQQAQAFNLFNERTSFQNQLGSFVIDDYENPGYLTGDISDGSGLDVYSNASISSVVGETQYETTTGYEAGLGFTVGTGYNIIFQATNSNHRYCAGCNGSFSLNFNQTSVGTAVGVFGAGFDISDHTNDYFAHVTFGDNNEQDFSLAGLNFFGITSNTGIKSFDIGLAGGQPTTAGSIAIDNLTIGEAVPEPSSLLGLLAAGALGLGLRQKRKSNHSGG